jgi:hypothetical protein
MTWKPTPLSSEAPKPPKPEYLLDSEQPIETELRNWGERNRRAFDKEHLVRHVWTWVLIVGLLAMVVVYLWKLDRMEVAFEQHLRGHRAQSQPE